jgi:hypothetical protein
MSRDKDVRTCLHNVLTVVPPSHIHFVQVHIPAFQAWCFLTRQLFTAVQKFPSNFSGRAVDTVPGGDGRSGDDRTLCYR